MIKKRPKADYKIKSGQRYLKIGRKYRPVDLFYNTQSSKRWLKVLPIDQLNYGFELLPIARD